MSSIAPATTPVHRFAAQPLLVRRAAVLGAGTMGSRIAAHLANAGIPALLLDMVPDRCRIAEPAGRISPRRRLPKPGRRPSMRRRSHRW